MELHLLDRTVRPREVLGELPGDERLPGSRRPMEDDLPLVPQKPDGSLELATIQQELLSKLAQIVRGRAVPDDRPEEVWRDGRNRLHAHSGCFGMVCAKDVSQRTRTQCRCSGRCSRHS